VRAAGSVTVASNQQVPTGTPVWPPARHMPPSQGSVPDRPDRRHAKLATFWRFPRRLCWLVPCELLLCYTWSRRRQSLTGRTERGA
jgi:hypothetical protein